MQVIYVESDFRSTSREKWSRMGKKAIQSTSVSRLSLLVTGAPSHWGVPPESSETGMCIHQFLPATGWEQLQNASSWNCRVSHTAAQPALAATECPQAESQVCAVQEHTGTGSVMWDGQWLLLTWTKAQRH